MNVGSRIFANGPGRRESCGDCAVTAITDQRQCGSFSAVSASLRQLSCGLGSVLAAAIISQHPDGSLLHFERIGYVAVTTAIITLVAMYFVQKEVAERAGKRMA